MRYAYVGLRFLRYAGKANPTYALERHAQDRENIRKQLEREKAHVLVHSQLILSKVKMKHAKKVRRVESL